MEGKGPQRRPQKRLDRRLEEVAKAVGGGYCRLQMPLKLALGVRETVAGQAGRPGGTSPPSNASLLLPLPCRPCAEVLGLGLWTWGYQACTLARGHAPPMCATAGPSWTTLVEAGGMGWGVGGGGSPSRKTQWIQVCGSEVIGHTQCCGMWCALHAYAVVPTNKGTSAKPPTTSLAQGKAARQTGILLSWALYVSLLLNNRIAHPMIPMILVHYPPTEQHSGYKRGEKEHSCKAALCALQGANASILPNTLSVTLSHKFQ